MGSPEWRPKAWQLKLKYGFDVPFYRRMARVYDEKYQYLPWIDNYPNPYNPAYLDECRDDVYAWFVQQPDGYRAELAGEARGLAYILSFLRDQTDKMQDMIAQECAVVMARQHEAVTRGEEVDRTNRAAFKATMGKAFDAERALLAAKQSLQARIESEEEKSLAAVEKKAMDLAEKHKTWFAVRYPFTYATEEMPPHLAFEVRTLPTKVKGPVRLTVDQEIVGLHPEAPAGWKPGKRYKDRLPARCHGLGQDAPGHHRCPVHCPPPRPGQRRGGNSHSRSPDRAV